MIKALGPALYRSSDWARESDIIQPAYSVDKKARSAARRDYARLVHCPSFRRLQGKTQLLPIDEGDFFRNRLTHSIEVAQIAKSIGLIVNESNAFFRKQKLDLDLLEFAALAHDIGHPPFGHNGEDVLDELMRDFGGFEGNAQTLRIVAKLEKRQTQTFPHYKGSIVQIDQGKDVRTGLNCSYRALASVLKYDRQIPGTKAQRRQDFGFDDRIVKGYYKTEEEVVKKIKSAIAGNGFKGVFKTVECAIMDVADDIAYSTYDLEDAFKAGFLDPLKIFAARDSEKEAVFAEVNNKVLREYAHSKESILTLESYNEALIDIFGYVYGFDVNQIGDGSFDTIELGAKISGLVADTSAEMARNGYRRAGLTSNLVDEFIHSVNVDINEQNPALSKVYLSLDAFQKVEILKTLNYKTIIMSSAVRASDYRGRKIIKEIFEALDGKDGHQLMPADWRQLVEAHVGDGTWKKRVVCDYIAGMTDRYCRSFYDRICGSSGPSIQQVY